MESRTPLCSNLETDIDVTSYDFFLFFFFLTFVSILWCPLFLVHISLGPATVITALPLYPAWAGVAFGLSSAVSGFKSASTKSLVNKPTSRTPRPPPSLTVVFWIWHHSCQQFSLKDVYRELTCQLPCRTQSVVPQSFVPSIRSNSGAKFPPPRLTAPVALFSNAGVTELSDTFTKYNIS